MICQMYAYLCVRRYHWRPSYADMTDDEIVTYITEAREFAFSDETEFSCIFSTEPACCLSWAGTKLETDFLFGDISEVDGTIKVNMKSRAQNLLAICALELNLFTLGLALWGQDKTRLTDEAPPLR